MTSEAALVRASPIPGINPMMASQQKRSMAPGIWNCSYMARATHRTCINSYLWLIPLQVRLERGLTLEIRSNECLETSFDSVATGREELVLHGGRKAGAPMRVAGSATFDTSISCGVLRLQI